ncbi:BCAS3 microtubule associated cell migration factor-like isoform X2 [Paramacrobiotus metropolitanus]|uniref:BCAS3 microtubule associated cell migration factor-like isoform X2 n=1 Tax=Paramacrobiotus metropolitanus TaxID=2943436 RepID=UPI002446080B|nr:BCAS3 microtubule associated cell migration factor-like isoform X2 [Paramacrobiotus metropolitanus]
MSGDVAAGNGRAMVVVRPQKVSADKTVVQSVVDFINDVLPQGNVPHKANDKESIIWIKIEQPERLGDIADTHLPFYLIFGYTNGVQIWAIEAHGEAWEVYSSRHGPVRTLRLLPLPEEVLGSADNFAEKRPLMAICDSAQSNSQPFTSVSIISLQSGKPVHNLKYRTAVEEIYCNQRVLIVTFPDRFVVIDACTFKDRLIVPASFPVHLVSPNPVALGKRWVAYSESKLHDMYHSLGGRMIDGVPSYTASVISAAKTIQQGITNISEVVANSISGTKKFTTTSSFANTAPEGKQEGVVTVLDIEAAGDGEVSLEKGGVNRTGVVAHFLAHSSSNVAALAFSVDGSLLLTASQTGQHFHLFRIQPHPAGSSMTLVQHLYTLHRGDTNATVQDMAFSLDSRWVAVTSLRATTHVFPITPYGGPITCRTHSSARVVNKSSRFMKSAGLDELEPAVASVNGSPATATASATAVVGSTSPRFADTTRVQVQAPPTVAAYTTPSSSSAQRVPHFRSPVIVQPLIQIKHMGPSKAPGNLTSGRQPAVVNETVKVAACFAARRSRSTNEPQAVCDALLIATSHGALVEYSLQPVVPNGPGERISSETPVGLSIHAQSQWVLNRHLGHPEFLPANFTASHPLLNSPALSADQASHKPDPEPSRFLEMQLTEKIVNLAAASDNEMWLSQVEIVTNAGPARRLWMGPQFHFTPSTSPGCSTSIPLSSLAQAEIMRTGSDWDLSDLKLANMRIRSAPMNLPSASGSNYSLTIEAGSEYLTRDSSSADDLHRVSEIADAMLDVTGRDAIDGIHTRFRGGGDVDESPEDLSVSSAESTHSGGHGSGLPHPAAVLLGPNGSLLPLANDFDNVFPLANDA